MIAMKKDWIWAFVVGCLLLYVAYSNWPRGQPVTDNKPQPPQHNVQIDNLQDRARQQTTIVVKPSDSITDAIREWNNE